MDEKKPPISTGSMFKASESWYCLGCNAILASGMADGTEMVQMACAIGSALVTSVYIYVRGAHTAAAAKEAS